MKKNDRRLRNEIEHGKFLAHGNAGEIWNWETPAGRIRWRRRVGLLTDPLREGMRVLEIGCGTGFFTREIAKKRVHLTAIDISPDLIRIARRELRADSCAFVIDSVNRMSFRDAVFDAVIGSSVLHHLDVTPALNEIHRVLKPGGRVAFTEPNMLNPQIALQKNIPALKKSLGDSPDETAFFSWRIRRKLRERGFSGISVVPFDFLHPRIPGRWIPALLPLTVLAEKTPILRQISGSLFIQAVK